MYRNQPRDAIRFSFQSDRMCPFPVISIRSLRRFTVEFVCTNCRLNSFNHYYRLHGSTFREMRSPRKVYRRYAAKARLLSAYEVAKSGLHVESLSAPTTRNSLPFLHFSNTSLERSTRTRILVKSCVAHTPHFRRSRVRPREFFVSLTGFPNVESQWQLTIKNMFNRE